MKHDFSGYATKANIRCSDGKTIMPDAFKHQDQMQVPLVWMHGHNDPENVLGHAILEARNGDIYTRCYFNNTPKAQHTKEAVVHKDITMLSIWANGLLMKAGAVLHGAIKEVSLVLSGANPGAVIDNIVVEHSDGEPDSVLEDEAIITMGIPIELSHSDTPDGGKDDRDDRDDDVQKVYDSLNDRQRELVHSMLGEALDVSGSSDTKKVKDADGDADKDKKVGHADGDEDKSVADVFNAMTDEQKEVVYFMVGQAAEAAGTAQQDDLNDDSAGHGDKEGTQMITHNVFEDKKAGGDNSMVLSHDDMKGILKSAMRGGSMKGAFEEYALAHGINEIDVLFPDAKAIADAPEWNRRRTEWATALIGSARKSPFSRIKTLWADLTEDDARAKGYVTGAFKKEEFFPVAKRVTTPTTVYKKQALDRDDVVDITDFEVIAWMKGEMRLMLDEEVARAMLLGDGRDIASEDKIDEQCIRPIATDHELYTTQIYVNVDDASSSMLEVMDAVIMNRAKLKGTGMPTFFTTEYWIARFLLVRDGDNKRMYRNLEELAMELRVDKIVPVEVMLEYPDIIGVMVNPVDYVLGANKGGEVNFFDDFDIDYNKLKYLIETRLSGALVKLKAAMVINRTAGSNVLVTPAAPTYVPATGALTIVNTTGVVYKNAGGTTIDAAGSPYTVAPGTTYVVNATPATGYYFGTSDDDSWSFTRPAA
jgi:hypothetical protein